MVRRKFAVSMFLLAALGASMGAGPVSAKAPVLPNALQLAILRWYPAGQAASFPVGTDPAGMAFDGANIWVANDGSNNVTKLRASDGAKQGTFAVGTLPIWRGLRRRQYLGDQLCQQQRDQAAGQ